MSNLEFQLCQNYNFTLNPFFNVNLILGMLQISLNRLKVSLRIATEMRPGIWKQVQELSIPISYIFVSLSILRGSPLPLPGPHPPTPSACKHTKWGPVHARLPSESSLRPASVQNAPP